MPIHSGKDSKGPFIQWGNQKKYYYKAGDKRSLVNAKEKAKKQMNAIFASGYHESVLLKNSKFNLLYEEIMTKLLKEGGHAFTNVGPILKDNINETISNLNNMFFKPLGISEDMWTSEIGSVGKKDQSGDIDIAMDFGKLKEIFKVENDNDVRRILMDKLTEIGIENKKVSINVHMAFPIAGTQSGEFVQIDLFPSKDLEFTKQEKFSPYAKDSKYKGAHRRLAIASLVKSVSLAIADDAVDDEKQEYVSPDGRTYPGIRFKFISLNEDGFYQVTKTFKGKRPGTFKTNPEEDKSKRQLITKNFQEILDILFGKNVFNASTDLYSFETIWNNILMSEKFPYKDKLNDIIRALYGIFENSGNVIPTEVSEYVNEHNLL